VAALLLTWLHQTEDFRDLEETASVLERLEKPQLIALVERMIKRYPDLEDMLELPDLGATGAASRAHRRGPIALWLLGEE
jgi:hypothetical protein